MPRFALKLEYHGGPFAGWQRQTGQASVQEALEAALRRLDATCIGVTAAGRTDAGVHATAQVVHCDLQRAWDPFRLSEALNWHLKPLPVSVLKAAEVQNTFHARFSAIRRSYLFRLLARRAPATHDRGLVWQVGKTLDSAKMREAAAHLIGRHDFTTFRSVQCQANSPVKTLDMIQIDEMDLPHGREYRFLLEARSFLHNQVRSVVGTLERVGAGAWNADDVADALAAQNRARCGPVAPPDGLYLVRVDYAADPFR